MEPTEQAPTGATQAPAPSAPEKNGTDYGTVEEILENADGDIQEDDVEAFGTRLRVRGLTAQQKALVQQATVQIGGRGGNVNVAEGERLQFQYGVIKPKFSPDQVKSLQLKAGIGWTTVIAKIDELTGTSQEDRARAEATFQ